MATIIPTSSVNAYWSFDGTFLADSTGHGNTLSTVGTVTGTTGKIGNGTSTLNADDYLSILTNSYVAPTSSFSISFWVLGRPSGTSINSADISDDNGFRITTGGLITAWINPANGSFYTGTQSVLVSVWNLIVITYNAGTETIGFSVNGATIETFSASPGGYVASSNPFTLGYDHPGGIGPLNSKLDEVAIYNRALTSDEKDWLWNSGNGQTWSNFLGSLNIYGLNGKSKRLMNGSGFRRGM